jgi:thioester reductase-like protein
MAKIFLTGVTGLVGSAFTVSLVRKHPDTKIVVLTRKSSTVTARQRVENAIIEQCQFDGYPDSATAVMSAIEVIDGDVVDLDPAALASNPLMSGVDTVFHCAADVNLGKDTDGKTFKINYEGTKNVLALAKLLKVKTFHYVSTAYVAGQLNGRAMEGDPVNSGFNNSYEKSKYEAELLVRASGIPFTVYRPSIIIGRRLDGRIRKPLAFYRILEFLAKLKSHRCAKLKLDVTEWVDLQVSFKAIPSDYVYFVPIDYVQEAISALFECPVSNQTYHITGDCPLSTILIDEVICKVLKLKGVTVEEVASSHHIDEKLLAKFLGDLLPYFSSEIVFDQSNVKKALGAEALNWEIGEDGLRKMMTSFFADYYTNVEWLQKVIST